MGIAQRPISQVALDPFKLTININPHGCPVNIGDSNGRFHWVVFNTTGSR